MFLRAGFNAHHTVVCRAKVRLEGRSAVHWAKLIRFAPSGDLAWYSPGGQFLVWGEHIRLAWNVLDDAFHGVAYDSPSVHIESFHRKLQAARDAGCLAVAR